MKATRARAIARDYDDKRTIFKTMGLIDLSILESACNGNTHVCFTLSFPLSTDMIYYLTRSYEKKGYKIEIFGGHDRTCLSIDWDVECTEGLIPDDFF